MTMDLSTLKTQATATAGAWLHLRHPISGELLGDPGAPVRILCAGKDSEQYQTIARAQQARRLEDGARNRGKTLTPERLRAEALELLAGVTLRWENMVMDGAALDCTADVAQNLYRGEAWIREQVDEFVDDRAHFLPASKTT